MKKSGVSLRNRRPADQEAVEQDQETIDAFGEDAGKSSDTEASASSSSVTRLPSSPSSANVLPMRAPPHSQEAEQAILGGLMLEPRAYEEVADKIEISSFYFGDHQIIYKVIEMLQNASRPCDAMMVAETLESMGHLERIGRDYLASLVDSVVTTANIGAYAEIVQEHATKRRLVEIGSEVARMGLDSNDMSATEMLGYAEKQFYNVAEAGMKSSNGFEDLNSVLTKAIDNIAEMYENGGETTGLPTGFTDLDEMTSGMHGGDLIIVAARPSMGKTTFSMNIAENVAINTKKAVGVFSLEMPKDQLVMRMISSLGRIDQGRVRNGSFEDRDWTRLSGAVQQLSNANIHIDDTPALSPTDLRSRARRLARQHDLGLILIDYLQLMQIPGHKENRTNEVSEISRSLKALAKELDVPVIALSQLNRSLEQRTNRRPVMSDLRESGAIEQDADTIMFIYRDEVYNPETEKKNMAEIILGKQRNGPVGTVVMTFQGRFTRFENFAEDLGQKYGYGEDYLPSQGGATMPPPAS